MNDDRSPKVSPVPVRPARDFENRHPGAVLLTGLAWFATLLAVAVVAARGNLGLGLPVAYCGVTLLTVAVFQPPYLWHALRERRVIEWFRNEDTARVVMGLLGVAFAALGTWLWRSGAV